MSFIVTWFVFNLNYFCRINLLATSTIGQDEEKVSLMFIHLLFRFAGAFQTLLYGAQHLANIKPVLTSIRKWKSYLSCAVVFLFTTMLIFNRRSSLYIVVHMFSLMLNWVPVFWNELKILIYLVACMQILILHIWSRKNK